MQLLLNYFFCWRMCREVHWSQLSGILNFFIAPQEQLSFKVGVRNFAPLWWKGVLGHAEKPLCRRRWGQSSIVEYKQLFHPWVRFKSRKIADLTLHPSVKVVVRCVTWSCPLDLEKIVIGIHCVWFRDLIFRLVVPEVRLVAGADQLPLLLLKLLVLEPCQLKAWMCGCRNGVVRVRKLVCKPGYIKGGAL